MKASEHLLASHKRPNSLPITPWWSLWRGEYVTLVLKAERFGAHISITPVCGDVTIIYKTVDMCWTISRVEDLPYFKSDRCGVRSGRTYHMDNGNRGAHSQYPKTAR